LYTILKNICNISNKILQTSFVNLQYNYARITVIKDDIKSMLSEGSDKKSILMDAFTVRWGLSSLLVHQNVAAILQTGIA